jgi:uncharacterized protein
MWRMRVRRLDPEGFLRVAGAFLRAREAEHNLLLGLAGRLVANPRLYGGEPYLAVVEERGHVVVASLRTPPHNLVLSETVEMSSYVRLAEDAHAAFGVLPGVVAPIAAVETFVSTWKSLSGDDARRVRAERIYQAAAVIPARPVAGRARPAVEADRALLVDWLAAFIGEAIPGGNPEAAAGTLDQRSSDPDGGLVLWEDGEPASLAGYGSPTPKGIRIGPVYTPPQRRGRGYASALVADVTANLLAGGRRFCFLFTDLANPTSNSIYQQVGYRPVADVEQWSFEARARFGAR